jgi:pyridoxal phosphate-dependent aminotransferase EpsN
MFCGLREEEYKGVLARLASALLKMDKPVLPRIYLSPPHMSGEELEFVKDTFTSNWIAPLGPQVDAFEVEMAEYLGVSHAAALASGTAAIHLALRLTGLQPGDEVLCPALTFSATANPVLYERARPVFVDCGATSWNIDPALLREELDACARRGRLPRAIIVVDLYGEPADYHEIQEVCSRYDVPIIQDAAEALGATYAGRRAGAHGYVGILSFNGNKIITTSGGGMLVSNDGELIEHARFLAAQARDRAPHYQHSSLGFNYRMSNVLAAIGRAQLRVLPERIAARRRNFEFYLRELGALPGISFMPQTKQGSGNHWLTCITIDPAEFGANREALRLLLEAHNIEARPVWKPLHLQPIFAGFRARGGERSEAIFERGLCLPSGSNLSQAELERICGLIVAAPECAAAVRL